MIPRAAYTERTTHRQAVEGRDTTLARLTYPEFVGARSPAALDSLRAMVNALLVAPPGGRGAAATGPVALMDGFIAEWNAQRRATRSRAYWRLDRRIEVLSETLGVVSLAASEVLYQGGEHPMSTVRLVNVDADGGHTIRFADLFREESRDSLSAALEPLFREARGIAADSSLSAMGFGFEDDRFRVGDNIAVTARGVRWHFDPYEIAPYPWGPTDIVAPFDRVRPYARPEGRLGGKRR
ncbi:MAG: RsiV family protein [Candidatus Eisenbacteria bacterium]